jgi:hypothetical protein
MARKSPGLAEWQSHRFDIVLIVSHCAVDKDLLLLGYNVAASIFRVQGVHSSRASLTPKMGAINFSKNAGTYLPIYTL